VSHFVKEGTAIDEEAADRSTTVYLVDRRIDMLPKELSEGIDLFFWGGEACRIKLLHVKNILTALKHRHLSKISMRL